MTSMTELMAEHGYRSVTIGDVGHARGVSRAAFYAVLRRQGGLAFAASPLHLTCCWRSLREAVWTHPRTNGFNLGLLEVYLRTLHQGPRRRSLLSCRDVSSSAPIPPRLQRGAPRPSPTTSSPSRAPALARRDLAPVARNTYLGAVYAVRQVALRRARTSTTARLVPSVPDLADGWLRASCDSARGQRRCLVKSCALVSGVTLSMVRSLSPSSSSIHSCSSLLSASLSAVLFSPASLLSLGPASFRVAPAHERDDGRKSRGRVGGLYSGRSVPRVRTRFDAPGPSSTSVPQPLEMRGAR